LATERRRAPALAGVLLLGMLAACSSSGASTSAKAPFSVPGSPVKTDHVEAARSYRFSPAVIEVNRGDTVTWTNKDQFQHTVQLVTGADQSTHDLGIGQTATITFSQPGVVYYRCSIHPVQMRGKVIVD
jgi:plastocyanin